MKEKVIPIFWYSLPIVVLIGLVPVVQNDLILAAMYALCIVTLLNIKSEKNDLLAVLFGLVGITASEYLFVMTGVETFTRNSLFGIMPLWLPLLWAYAFLTIKRCLRILDR